LIETPLDSPFKQIKTNQKIKKILFLQYFSKLTKLTKFLLKMKKIKKIKCAVLGKKLKKPSDWKLQLKEDLIYLYLAAESKYKKVCLTDIVFLLFIPLHFCYL
jgi:hypothetical protein